ncbi:MAG: tRNA (adenosine(37)-N6)-threonylcarbamoyltransferase complex dimerization subunit type 1 TsaB [Tannerellaceae bacterium]|jgi:tRNA threonylcarbamoyladenosine biosynthesis protein TsaB|nr:tRNA (adenosine(37)-N6)-threonylcarbamoyltransferase complex dimerization subunit type 1 TsaB [Tannerellaceae bacterium]
MPCLLHIETSTKVCSVALSLDGAALFERASFDGPSHAALAGVYVEDALNLMRRRGLALDAVAVSGGPGSYTGLRIGVSLAKGICFGYGIPLINVHTLKVMAGRAIRMATPEAPALYCAMLDARRMEVYAALFDAGGDLVRETRAEVVDAYTYAAFLACNRVFFFGNGAAKCMEVIASPEAVFVDGVHPLAVDMILPAEEAFLEGRFEDLAYFEPFYLKEFAATTPKNKIFTHKQ